MIECGDEWKQRVNSSRDLWNPALLLRAKIPRSNAGQVAHVSRTRVTLQEADITRRAPEGACWLRLGCWSNNSAISCPSPGAFHRRVLRSCLVPQCSYPPHRPRHQRRLANCDWMPAPFTSGQPSNTRRHPTCWAPSQWSHAVFSTPCHVAWTSAPLSAHLSIQCKRTAPQNETSICTRHTTSHQFIWQQQHTYGAVGGSPMECWVGGQLHKTPHFHPRHRHPPAGMTLLRRAWVRLNRLRTGVGRFPSCLYKWGMASSAACDCGAEKPTVDHVVLQCPIHRPPHGPHGLTVPDDETIEWLLNICPEI